MAFTLDESRWVGHTTRAARQAGILFLLASGLSLLAIISFPDRRGPLLLLSGIELVIAVLALLPWRHLGRISMSVIAAVSWSVIGASTWAVGGIGSGSGAFFVLAFAWMGLHLSRRMILVNAPVAACAYAVALVLNDVTREALAGTVLVIPFALSIGLIIEGRVRRLKAARQALEEEQSWRAALMATLAHDVRSPLTTIQGALEILSEDAQLPAHLEPLVAAAARQTARLTILASSLLDLERVEGGKLVLDLQQVDVEALTQQVAELLDDRSIRVEVEAGLTVRADPVRLQQMLVNLGNNALRHGEPPVVMGARMADGMVELVVRDHGVGVATADRPHLFERLNRTSENPESVGLGLWIVRLLARSHGGDATHRPADVGSEFVITLPQAGVGALESPTRTNPLMVPADNPV